MEATLLVGSCHHVAVQRGSFGTLDGQQFTPNWAGKEMAAARLAVLVAALAISSCTPTLAQAPGVRVFVANGVKDFVQELRQEAEQAIRLPLLIETGEAALLETSLEKGAPFDVAILPDWAADELVKSGKAIGTSRLTLARAAIGLCVRMGAAKPKIDTVDTFKEAMVKAESVAVTAATNPGSARHALEQAFERLGIANVMKPKTILAPVDQATQWVADGKAQFAINYVGNILSARGVDLVGAFPEELQRYIDFDVVSATTSRDSQAVRALLQFLGEPHDQQLRAHGNEPPRLSPQR
jgi:molybdate transport system substrate-binding protein